MKRMFMVMGLFVLLFTAARAQEKKFGMYAVGFYNQENLPVAFRPRPPYHHREWQQFSYILNF